MLRELCVNDVNWGAGARGTRRLANANTPVRCQVALANPQRTLILSECRCTQNSIKAAALNQHLTAPTRPAKRRARTIKTTPGGGGTLGAEIVARGDLAQAARRGRA